MTSEQHTGSGPAAPAAVRLIFEYEGPDIRLVSRQRVDAAPPPTDDLTGPHPTAATAGESEVKGFWVEVRDGRQRPLYRRVMHPPVRHDAEVFSDDAERSLARVPVDEPKGTFAVLVPEIEGADHVALVSSPLTPGPTVAAAAEVARFSLTPDTDETDETPEGGR
ncbi:hypothetical protein J7W19_28285 [Streptomyces mobaraensis NBRC 13819 = DSM 40847]|uniref:Uncharacterized protein n=1 Tax=Streptomyces mobaraensis (strain ATCC 29032 / DSM 40847 / JCM 4168 / NBRC 13819 / NCIMB 11159 / IPCR 16-22) TaxID=1223523 RepID=M3C1U1_STRM1|nr:hypothetical protein [Streptomyces mobaraensis]EME97960.1 hypothetical protein H340_23758 [Streptomyces mobaraensis NBRC 13819 = DSM 40847]QTT76757.1 hypothetical protein J7W19_28285 [Streptomyces mobaraensis NBRC 13819 = DSM 40847]